MRPLLLFAATMLATFSAGCTVVRPWERGELANPTMRFQMAPVADEQEASVLEITEGTTFSSAGPGSAGAGCGCH